MSIRIDQKKCIACHKCLKVCPGNLLYKDEDNKAFIKYPKDCWGCTACLKECPVGAIKYFLGADIGGQGTYLYTKDKQEFLHWVFVKPDGQELAITINKGDSNKY